MNRTGQPRPTPFRFPTLLLTGLAALTAACGGSAPAGSEAAGAETVYGEAIPLGDGTARTYIRLENGAPVEVGVALSEAALSNLPVQHGPGSMPMPDGNSVYEFVLALPVSNPTPYQHVTLDWNPGGHEPPGLYDRPHFDVHFYTIPDEERRTILPTDPRFAEKAAHFPAPEFVPAGYFAPEPAAVPMMGVHWLDPASPELNGQEFTSTFIYGSWDGRMIFAEPMVTQAFLETKPDFGAPIPVAEQQQVPGYHPASYAVRWNEQAREYRISLGDFTQRN